jgi:hypothetical protein
MDKVLEPSDSERYTNIIFWTLPIAGGISDMSYSIATND